MQPQQKREGAAQLTALDNAIDKAVRLQILRPLEVLRQLLTDGLLNHAGAGEADQRPRLGQRNISKAGEAGADAAGRRVGKAGDMKAAPFMKRAIAAEVLAICIREKIPSCMRAPPLAEKIISGRCDFAACSTARVSFSPTAALMLPIRKRLSITANTAFRPSILPVAVTIASDRPVFCFSSASFSE